MPTYSPYKKRNYHPKASKQGSEMDENPNQTTQMRKRGHNDLEVFFSSTFDWDWCIEKTIQRRVRPINFASLRIKTIPGEFFPKCKKLESSHASIKLLKSSMPDQD